MSATGCPICKSSEVTIALHYDKYPLYIKPISKEFIDTVPLKPLTICLCNSCGYLFQEKPVDSSDLSSIYEENYCSYHSPAVSGIGSSLAKQFLSFLENTIPLHRKRVLEIGCFDGYFLTLLKNIHSCNVLGCDPSPGAEIAKKTGINVMQNYFSPDLIKEKFDICVLRGVLEHIPEPVPFLEDIHSVMEPEGIFAIEVPNVIYSLENGVIGDFFHEHMCYFTVDSLKLCLIKSGLDPVIVNDDGYYLRVITKPRNNSNPSPRYPASKNSVARLKQLFEEYNGLTENMRRDLRTTLADFKEKRVYIYGGGGHTIGLLSKTYDFLKPAGVIDGDPSKEGKTIPGFKIPVYSRSILDRINYNNSIIIVSSKIFQDEISGSLGNYILKGLQVIILYPKVQYIDKQKMQM